MPAGHFSPVTSPSDGITIGVLGVLVTRFAFRAGFAGPVALTGCKGGLALFAFLNSNGFNSFLRTERVGFGMSRF